MGHPKASCDFKGRPPAVGGFLVNSWSELGAPYWQPEMHWFDKRENKFYHAYLDLNRRPMNLQTSIFAETQQSFLQGLKPGDEPWGAPGLKPRPPKALSANCEVARRLSVQTGC